MTEAHQAQPTWLDDMPSHYTEDLDAERRGWYELTELVRSLTPEECLVAGYYERPDWNVRDVVAHIGTWLAEAQAQLERIRAGTYDGRDIDGNDIDVDRMNAVFLDAMRDQTWTTCWVQAHAGRTRMMEEWFGQPAPGEDGAWWVRKSGSEHYAEHLDRLRAWVAELHRRRTPASD